MGLESSAIHSIELDQSALKWIGETWGEKAARHLHFEDGFTLAALDQDRIVGLISSFWHPMITAKIKSRKMVLMIIFFMMLLFLVKSMSITIYGQRICQFASWMQRQDLAPDFGELTLVSRGAHSSNRYLYAKSAFISVPLQ